MFHQLYYYICMQWKHTLHSIITALFTRKATDMCLNILTTANLIIFLTEYLQLLLNTKINKLMLTKCVQK